MNQDSRGLFSELVRDRDTAGTNLFQRLKKVNRLLSDREWVRDPTGGGGDESRAIDRIEEFCFGPESGLSLPEMLEVLAAVPQESVWRQKKYSMRKMLEEVKARKEAARSQTQGGPPSNGNGRHSPQGATAGGKSHPEPLPTPEEQVRSLKVLLREKDQRISELERENKKLKKAFRELKRMVGDLQTVEV